MIAQRDEGAQEWKFDQTGDAIKSWNDFPELQKSRDGRLDFAACEHFDVHHLIYPFAIEAVSFGFKFGVGDINKFNSARRVFFAVVGDLATAEVALSVEEDLNQGHASRLPSARENCQSVLVFL